MEVSSENRPGASLQEACDPVSYIHLNSRNVLNSLQRCLKLHCKRWRNFSAETFILPWYFYQELVSQSHYLIAHQTGFRHM